MVDTIAQINAVYDTLTYQDATQAQITTWQAVQQVDGDAANIATVVNSGIVQDNGVPILDAFHLTAAYYPSAHTYDQQLGANDYNDIIAADVQSQQWANQMNNGTPVNDGDPITSTVVNEMYLHGLGYEPTQATMNQWLGAGLTMESGFLLFLQSTTYAADNNANDDATLTGYANAALEAAGGGEAPALGVVHHSYDHFMS